MEDNNTNRPRLSKEEMVRRISGSVSARSNDEIRSREESRRRAEEYEVFRRSPVNNPYMANRSGRTAPRTGRSDEARRKAASQAAKEAARKKKLKQRRKRIVTACITLLVMLSLAGIGGLTWYTRGKAAYDGVFLDNTFINGATVSKMSPKEAEKIVRQYSDMPDFIVLTRPDGLDVKISLKSLDAKDNIYSQVKELYNSQSHSDWFKAKNSKSEYNFPVKFDFDREKLYKEVKAKIVDGQKTTEPENAYISRGPDGFSIVPEVVGSSIDDDKLQLLYDYIDGFLDRGAYSIDLKNCNCYKMPAVTSEDLTEQLATLDRLFDAKFTFDFGYTKEVLKGSVTFDWITFENNDPTQGYTVDEDKVMAYVEDLAEKYDTYGKTRKFKSTTRGNIKVKQGKGSYGWWIDQEKTAKLLTDLVKDGISGTVKPYYYEDPLSKYSYTADPDTRTKDGDLGNTYCEVDLAAQHFWYYEHGEKKYDCDIVSGLPTEARNTPEGVYKIWYKEKNKVLSGTTSEGESWTTPVTYWNNISTFGIGLHDANWHDSFGGDRYKTNGSHGCINMPTEAAKYVFDNIPLGTPVVMYW